MPSYIYFVEDANGNELGVFPTWNEANKFRRNNRSIYGEKMRISHVMGEMR